MWMGTCKQFPPPPPPPPLRVSQDPEILWPSREGVHVLTWGILEIQQMGVATNQPLSRIMADVCFQPVYTTVTPCIPAYSIYPHSSCLFQCHCQHNCYPLCNRCACPGCISWLFFVCIIFRAHLQASWLPSCTKIFLTVHIQPMAIALIEHIWNDIQ